MKIIRSIILLSIYTICLLSLKAYVCPTGLLPINTANSDYDVMKKNPINACYDPINNTVTFVQLNIPPLKNVQKTISGTQNPGYHLIGTVNLKDTDGSVKTYNLWSPTATQALTNAAQSKINAQNVADVLFNPTSKQKDGSVTQNPYPTISLNQQAAQTLLSAMGADATLITKYQQFYFYLEYAARVDLAARMAIIAPTKGIDMFSAIEKSWASFIKSMIAAYGSWQNLEDACFQVAQPNYQNLIGTIQAKSWNDLTKTEFWTSMPLSLNTLKSSTFWQDYLKYMICYTFDQDQTLLLSIKQIEETLFKYTPNLEVAYNQKDFTTLRHSSEIFHTRLIINDALRLRLLKDINDWSKIKDAQGNFDLIKIHAQASIFAKTDFYTLASYAQNHSSAVIDAAAQSTDTKNQNQISALLKNVQQTLFFQESLTLLAMIKSLQALTNPLFDEQYLQKSMQALASTNQKPSPSIIVYAPEDEIFLDDINQIQQAVSQKATQPTTAKNLRFTTHAPAKTRFNYQVHPQGWIGDAWNEIKGVGEDIGEDIESMTEALIRCASMSFNNVIHFLTTVAPEEAMKLIAKSKDLEDEVINGVVDAANKAGKMAEYIVDQAEKGINIAEKAMKDAADSVTNAIDGACNWVIQGHDKELCTDVAGTFRQLAEMSIDRLAEMGHIVVDSARGMVQLTEDAVHACAKITADVMTGQFKNLGNDIVDGLKNVAMDMATSILSRVTLIFQYFTEQLVACLKLVQYVISMTVRIFIDAVTAMTYLTTGLLEVLGVPIDADSIAEAADSWLSQHERVIGAVITTVVLVAAIPFTDGMSLGLLAMTIGPQLFDVYGSFEQDQLISDQKHEEQQFVATFKDYVDNNEMIYQQQQNEWTQELNLKFQSQVNNQARGLGFYENFMNSSIEGYKTYYGHILGSYWSNILKKPTNEQVPIAPADVGDLYGMQTEVYNLNPSQGFALYSPARKSFSQELAVAPVVIDQSEPNKPVLTKNWFNQKETIILDHDITSMEVRIRTIYTLPEFHIGLYFGGQQLDISSIISSENAPLDPNYLAIMAVYKKEEGDTQPNFGLYQHENSTQPWITKRMDAPEFNVGTWYHIKMQINGSNCTIKVWAEPNEEPSSGSSFTINATPSARNIGVISSGAALEYQYIQPVIPITMNPNARDSTIVCQTTPCKNQSNTTLLQPESAQELITHQVLDEWQNPIVGKFNLKAVDKTLVLRSKYIYITKDTHLTDQKGNVINDYVVACQGTNNTGSNYGKLPETNTDYIASLISNKVFNNNGNLAFIASDLFNVFLQQYGPLPDQLSQTISQARQNYVQNALSANWGVFKLTAYSADMINADVNVYKMDVLDQEGQPILDTSKKPITDYLIFVQLTSDDPNYQGFKDPSNGIDGSTQIGISYNTAVSTDPKYIGLISLVTGNLYTDRTTLRYNQNFNYDPGTVQSAYASTFNDTGAIPSTIDKDIQDSINNYNAAVNPPQAKMQAKGKAGTTQVTKANAIVIPQVRQGAGVSNPTPQINPSKESLLKRAQTAARGQ